MEQEIIPHNSDMLTTFSTEVTLHCKIEFTFLNNDCKPVDIERSPEVNRFVRWAENNLKFTVNFDPCSHGSSSALTYLVDDTKVNEVIVMIKAIMNEPTSLYNERIVEEQDNQ
jgi:hypothetical protein